MTLVSYSLVVKALGLVNDHSTIDDIDRRYLTFSGHVETHYFLFSTQIRTYRGVHESCRVFTGFSEVGVSQHIHYLILSNFRGNVICNHAYIFHSFIKISCYHLRSLLQVCFRLY